jgi:hypothetical protein
MFVLAMQKLEVRGVEAIKSCIRNGELKSVAESPPTREEM